MATKIFLIRHGITEWNLKKRYCGFVDVALSSKGKNQAKKLKKRMQEEHIDKIYTSDRKRALQTARIVFGKTKFEQIPDLREIHFGVFEGLTHKQIMKKYTRLYKAWLKDPYCLTIPKGEALADFKKRIVGALKKILALNKNRSVAVVCHGGAISVYLTHLLRTKGFWQHIPKAASVSVVEYKNKKSEIKLLNDTSHLDE